MLSGRWRNHFFTLHRRQTSPTAQQSPEARAGPEASPAHTLAGGRDGAGGEGSCLSNCIRPRLSIKEGPVGWEEADSGTMETQRASLSLGRWPLWLLLLGLAVPWASAQALSYREAVLRAVDRLNEQSSDPNLYRLLELDLPPKADEDPDAPKPVSFTVKETVCPRRTQQPPEQCDFKENGVVKQCVGTVTLDQSRDQQDITCDELQSVRSIRRPRLPRPRVPRPYIPPRIPRPVLPPPRFPIPRFPRGR
uniref:Protegrin-2-like isoform X2 n=2 Tax=Camelus TaxID=9836 RepID=A0A9W3H756_CAMBA|nr:protegrin-2-like isoform X2 [Camelus bactrianus]